MQGEQVEELFRQASELKQNSDWQGALAVYEKIYADESQRNNQNLVLSMLSCLKKLEQYERAIEIGLPACELEGRWDAVASLTAWCIYFHHFKNHASYLPNRLWNGLKQSNAYCLKVLACTHFLWRFSHTWEIHLI